MRTLIAGLLAQGIRNRNDVACRVWQVVPGFPAGDIGALLDEADDTGRRGGCGAAGPDEKLSTYEVGKPEYQSTRIFQETHRQPTSSTETHTIAVCEQKGSRKIYEDELQRSVPSSLPFGQYLAHAVEDHTARQRTPGGGWESDLWHLVRLVRAHPDMVERSARQAFDAVEEVLRQWRPAAGRRVADDWRRWLGVGRTDSQAEFFGAWDKVRYLPGRTPLMNALDQASRCPLELAAHVRDRRPDGYAHFVSIAAWLQVGMGDRPIYLPVQELAELLCVNPATVSRYRRWAVKDGYLREVKPYEFKGKGKAGKATEFRFDVSRWGVLAEVSQDGTAEGFRPR